MFYRRQSARILGLCLALAMLCGGDAWFGVRRAAAQQPAGATQTAPVNRPRRAGEELPSSQSTQPPQSSQPNAKPTPPAPDNDTTVDDDEVVKVDTSLTNIIFTAVDKNKRFITDVKQQDIRVTEDGVEQQVFTFQKQIDLPLTLAILIDTSISQERTLPEEKAAARSFVDTVLRQNRDEAAVLSFTGVSTLEQGLTGNPARVRKAIDKIEFVPPSGYVGGGVVVGGTPPISGDNQAVAGSTAIWDSIWVTCEDVLAESSDKTRRAIILLTDGEDTFSMKKLDEAVQQALKTDTFIFAIGIGDSFNHRGVDEGSLRKITERTGGRAYFPRSEEDLRNAFAQIQRELREQYLVAYSPTNKKRDGSYRQLKIEIVNPELRQQGVKLTYRQGYFAKNDAAPAKRQK